MEAARDATLRHGIGEEMPGGLLGGTSSGMTVLAVDIS